MPTPLAVAFYAAFKESGLTLESVARRANVSTATVWAYIQGTRGGSGRRNTEPKIRAIARALSMNEDAAVALSSVTRDPGVVDAIRNDMSLSRRDRSTLIELYKRMRD